jgi:hypothetical protein
MAQFPNPWRENGHPPQPGTSAALRTRWEITTSSIWHGLCFEGCNERPYRPPRQME